MSPGLPGIDLPKAGAAVSAQPGTNLQFVCQFAQSVSGKTVRGITKHKNFDRRYQDFPSADPSCGPGESACSRGFSRRRSPRHLNRQADRILHPPAEFRGSAIHRCRQDAMQMPGKPASNEGGRKMCPPERRACHAGWRECDLLRWCNAEPHQRATRIICPR